MPTPATRLHLRTAVQACEDKKGEDTRILELDPVDSGLADFFLITSAANDRQALAIADEIEFRLKQEFGLYAASVEGRRQAEWILLDYIDIVIHVFLQEKRAFYDIERLRKSARPLTPAEVAAEVDTDLKAALATKTRAVRSRTVTTKPSPSKPAKKTASPSKTTSRKTVLPPAKKATPKAKTATSPITSKVGKSTKSS